MSRIDELIAELCPEGVEYVGFAEVADYIRGVTYSKGDERADGEVLVLRANNITLASNALNFVDVRRVAESVTVRENQQLRRGDILMCAGSGSREHVGKVAFISEDLPHTFGGFMAVIRTNGSLEPKFLFHLLTGRYFSDHLETKLASSTINNVNLGLMRSLLLPVPPLAVQQEIVRILDKMEQLEAELEAELEARRKQYEHYRDSLLNFAEAPPLLERSVDDLG